MLQLSVVVPTFRERENVPVLVARLAETLAGIPYEIVFVDDDSPDGTAEAARAIAVADPRVRCVQRIGRRGLSSAVIEGVLASAAPVVVVMDGDLQHDERILPRMLERLRADAADVVVGTRYAGGGGFGDLSGTRVGLSRLATRVARRTLRAETSDPMSGFFMVRRDAFMEAVRDLSGIGFKILLDLLASSPRPLKVAEEPYSFRARQAGESKLDTMALWEFGMLLLDKTVGRFVPVRFIAFALIGGVGVGIHMAILATLLAVSALAFAAAHTVATVATMCANFALNNAITYRDRRLKGSAFVRGLLGFVAICSVGALANVGIAAVLFDRFETTWWASALAGILAGAVWNFAVSSIYTWRPRPPRPAPAPVLRPDPARSL